MTEILAPTLAEFAPPELAREEIPKLLRGDTMWCQGFSEPGTGSDLSSLSCRATQVDDHWVVNGQKLWTSLAQHASACVLLTRTGPPGSAHRGITAFFVDMDTPGDHRAPVRAAQRRPRVRRGVLRRRRRARRPHPGRGERRLGRGDEHPPVRAVDVASGTAPRSSPAGCSSSSNARPTTCTARRCSVRRSSSCTRCVLGRGSPSTDSPSRAPSAPETSVDKILVATAEQQMFDAARELLPGVVELDDSPDGEHWRSELPVLARGDHLRRIGRDPAQHRGPAAARPRTGGVDGDAVEAWPDGRDAATESTL